MQRDHGRKDALQVSRKRQVRPVGPFGAKIVNEMAGVDGSAKCDVANPERAIRTILKRIGLLLLLEPYVFGNNVVLQREQDLEQRNRRRRCSCYRDPRTSKLFFPSFGKESIK